MIARLMCRWLGHRIEWDEEVRMGRCGRCPYWTGVKHDH